MIALLILGIFAFLIILILFLPVNAFISFKDEFYIKIKLAGIKLFEVPTKKDKPKENTKKSDSQNESNSALDKAQGLFDFLKEKYGFFGAVKKLLVFFKDILTHIKKLLSHIKIKNINVKITVSGEDAASTAIEYGKVCSAVYPVLSFLDSFEKIEFKKIDINSDFSENKKEFEFSLKLKLQIIYMLIVAFKIYSNYKNFTLKENYNERK